MKARRVGLIRMGVNLVNEERGRVPTFHSLRVNGETLASLREWLDNLADVYSGSCRIYVEWGDDDIPEIYFTHSRPETDTEWHTRVNNERLAQEKLDAAERASYERLKEKYGE